jgi:hypothetical protein
MRVLPEAGFFGANDRIRTRYARTILVMCQEQRTGMVQEQRGNQNGIREKSQRVNSCTSTSFSHAQHLTQRKNAKAPVQKVPENDRLGQICRCSVPSILDPSRYRDRTNF